MRKLNGLHTLHSLKFSKSSHKTRFFILGFCIFLGVLYLTTGTFFASYLWDNYKLFYISLLLNSKDEQLAIEVGNYFFNGDGGYDINKAVYAFKKANKIHETFTAHYALSRLYLVAGLPLESILHVNKASLLDINDKRTIYVRGLAYANAGLLDLAEKEFKEFLAYAPKAWASYADLSWILLQEEKYEEAKKISEKGLKETEKDNPWLLNNLGVSLMNLGRAQDALSYFEKSRIFAEKISDEEWFRAYSGNAKSNIPILRNDFLASVYINTGSAYEKLENKTASEESYTKALSYLKEDSSLRTLILETFPHVDN
jgi:tetratricopeptide (TPR) repeat protein